MAAAHPPLESSVARRIAELRAETALTLREVATRAGLSAAYLSRVENGRTAVTLASLAKLAKVFGTPVAAFFEDESAQQRLVLCRAGTGRKLRFRGRNGTLVELLAGPMPHKLLEALIVDVASAVERVQPAAHPGEEFDHVLTGECTFHYDGTNHALGQGDSVYYDASLPHAFYPVAGKPCRLLAVVTSRDFNVHRNISKVLEGRIQA